jgi:ParB-like chromosome segregation protein Spo0J
MAKKKPEQIQIVYKSAKDLIPADYNPRQISEADFEQLKKSLQGFDCVEPLIINTYEGRENVVVGGHQRLKALIELGHKEVPCVEVNLDEEKEKELNIRLNKNTGQFDMDILATYFEPEQLIEYGFNEEELVGRVEEVPEERENVKDNFTDFFVLVTVKDETEQAAIYEEMTKRGLTCKLMN